MISCTTEDSRWLVYFDAQGRQLGEARVELWLGASYTLAGRHVVLSFRHENNFDTLLRGYSVAGDAPWSREYDDKLSDVTGVGDRLVCYDFDDNWVVLDPRDGSEIATYPLADDLHLPSFAPLGDGEVALIRHEIVAIFELETGVERRRVRLQFEGDDYWTVNELWPGPGGGYWVVRDIRGRQAVARRSRRQAARARRGGLSRCGGHRGRGALAVGGAGRRAEGAQHCQHSAATRRQPRGIAGARRRAGRLARLPQDSAEASNPRPAPARARRAKRSGAGCPHFLSHPLDLWDGTPMDLADTLAWMFIADQTRK